jgi:hypothetical protein
MEVIAGWFIMENLLKWMVYVDLIMLLHHFMASLNRKTDDKPCDLKAFPCFPNIFREALFSMMNCCLVWLVFLDLLNHYE